MARSRHSLGGHTGFTMSLRIYSGRILTWRSKWSSSWGVGGDAVMRYDAVPRRRPHCGRRPSVRHESPENGISAGRPSNNLSVSMGGGVAIIVSKA